MPTGRYQFQIFNPGVLAELYLPKKAEYQGALYKTLTEGFEPEKVIKHFRSHRTQKHIGHFLKHFSHYLMGVEKENMGDEIIKRIKDDKVVPGQSGYIGYSMYEVDGVFRGGDEQPIVEERTQVIRIIFQPELTALTDNLKEDFRVDPIDVISKAMEYLGSSPAEKQKMAGVADDMVERVIRYLQQWHIDTGLFLFGYIVFAICQHLEDLTEATRAQWKQRGKDYKGFVEDEIWVTVSWNFMVNTIEPRKQETNSKKENPTDG